VSGSKRGRDSRRVREIRRERSKEELGGVRRQEKKEWEGHKWEQE
jgi:hypothetical protein